MSIKELVHWKCHPHLSLISYRTEPMWRFLVIIFLGDCKYLRINQGKCTTFVKEKKVGFAFLLFLVFACSLLVIKLSSYASAF